MHCSETSSPRKVLEMDSLEKWNKDTRTQTHMSFVEKISFAQSNISINNETNIDLYLILVRLKARTFKDRFKLFMKTGMIC